MSEHIASGKVVGDQVAARASGEFTLVEAGEVDLMDVSPTQMISLQHH